MQFAKFGGTCPKWAVHKAFRTPERMLLQAVELPQGQKFFTIARTVPSLWTPAGESAPEFAIALGCEMHHTRDLVYADHLDTGKNLRPEPIGVGCAVCERMECGQRAHPPIGHDLQFDGHMRRVGLYDLGMK
jgi:predicted transcriptional regulator